MPLYARGERTSNGLGIITGNGQAKTKWHWSEHIINSHGLNVMMYHNINNQIAMISMAMATPLVMLWEILQLLAVAGHGKLSISSARAMAMYVSVYTIY